MRKLIAKFRFPGRISACQTPDQFQQLSQEAVELYGSWQAAVREYPELEELRRKFDPQPADYKAAFVKAMTVVAGIVMAAFGAGFLGGIASLGFHLATAWR